MVSTGLEVKPAKMISQYFCTHFTPSGLNVTEVAHDNHAAVRNFVVNDLMLMNSYDTWHGAANPLCVVLIEYDHCCSRVYRHKECGQGAEEGVDGAGFTEKQEVVPTARRQE